MICPQCNNDEVNDDAIYCGFCGFSLISDARCIKCRRPRKNNHAFCEGCGLQQSSDERDDSFLESNYRQGLEFIQKRRIFFTHFFMNAPARWLGVQRDGWAAEELAYLVGFLITYGILLALALFDMPCKAISGLILISYVVYRVLDIVTYELEIVFFDHHKDAAGRGGHLLSADRRVLCAFIHLLDFIGCYALLFMAIESFQGISAFSHPHLNAPIGALYFSVVVASFTGLSSVTPATDWARVAVISEVILNLVLFTILFARIVGSMGQLTEMSPRPPRALRVFCYRRSLFEVARAWKAKRMRRLKENKEDEQPLTKNRVAGRSEGRHRPDEGDA
jgi:hypothetical protein